MLADLNVAALRRRAPGRRTMLYLDQSTLSALASDPEWSELAERLRGQVRHGKLICPSSMAHSGESLLAGSWEAINRLTNELSLGVRFRSDDLIVWNEVRAAADAFLEGEPAPLWREAFDDDPQATIEHFFPGGLRVTASFPPDEYRTAEIQYQKGIEDQLAAVYDDARKAERSFAEEAELELEAMVYGYLGPLTEPERFEAESQRRLQAAAGQWLAGDLGLEPGSAVGLHVSYSIRKRRCESFANRRPQIVERLDEFLGSELFRSLPALRYPPLLRAALISTRERRPKPGDGYDISHLTNGLSRCDIVTADSGMEQLLRNFKLVPPDCQVFPFRDQEGLRAAIEAAGASVGEV